VTARFLTTGLSGDPTRRRAVLTTGTPGLYLWRHREPCPHENHTLPLCPGCEPWEWEVATGSGLRIGRESWHADEPFTLGEARTVATELRRTGVDWTAPAAVGLLDQLTGARLDAVVAVLRGHGVWTPADPVGAVTRTRARYAALAGTG
jgi:hypothetical protein